MNSVFEKRDSWEEPIPTIEEFAARRRQDALEAGVSEEEIDAQIKAAHEADGPDRMHQQRLIRAGVVCGQLAREAAVENPET